jgi:hypothetical protein
MPVHFLAADLSRWDDAEDEALLLTLFADERPLRGAAGLADWRLCGRLSRLLRNERLGGGEGEAMMLPPGRRLSFPRLVLLGLGSSASFDEHAYRAHVRRVRDVMQRARIRRYAVQPPGRATGLIAARRALELWLEEEASGEAKAEVSLIDTTGAHKEMADILRVQQLGRAST